MSLLYERLKVAAKAGEVVRIIYHGGSQPGTVREIYPIRVATLEISARDLATDIVKTFKLAKIELVDDVTDAPEYDAAHSDISEPAGIIEALDGKHSELENLGWHVAFSEDEASVYRFFKNGKPRKTADVSLSYDEFVTDLFVDDDGELHEDARHSTRPYRVDSLRFASGRTFGKLSRAAALFLEEAHGLAPQQQAERKGRRIMTSGTKQCPQCGEPLGGTAAWCASCGHVLSKDGDAAPGSKPNKKVPSRPTDSVQEADSDQVPTSDTKQCPQCSEDVKPDAVKCRYCGTSLTETACPKCGSGNTKLIGPGIKGFIAFAGAGCLMWIPIIGWILAPILLIYAIAMWISALLPSGKLSYQCQECKQWFTLAKT